MLLNKLLPSEKRRLLELIRAEIGNVDSFPATNGEKVEQCIRAGQGEGSSLIRLLLRSKTFDISGYLDLCNKDLMSDDATLKQSLQTDAAKMVNTWLDSDLE